MNSVKFIHIRNFDIQGQFDPRGGFTYAYREVSDGVEYAVAQCSSRDNFVKAYGRAKAQGRLRSPDHLRLYRGDAASFREAVYDGAV